MMSLLKNFNEGSITLRELANLAYDFKIINLKSPKIYEIIVDYFIKHSFTDVALINLGQRTSVNFIHAIFFCHPTLSNEAFFTVTRTTKLAITGLLSSMSMATASPRRAPPSNSEASSPRMYSS